MEGWFVDVDSEAVMQYFPCGCLPTLCHSFTNFPINGATYPALFWNWIHCPGKKGTLFFGVDHYVIGENEGLCLATTVLLKLNGVHV